MSVDNPETGGVKYSAEIRTQAYAMQNMSHQELCQEIIEIDNKAHMVGFKNGKFAMKNNRTQAKSVDNPEQILRAFRQYSSGGVLSDTPEMLTLEQALAALETYYNAHTTRKETEARLDELKPVAFRVKDALSVKAAPRSFVRFHLTDEFIDKRTAELEQKLRQS